MTRTTHTYAELEVSPEAYDEIAGKLKAAGYGHAFMHDGAIDMHGIGLTRSAREVAAQRLERLATGDAEGGGIERRDFSHFGVLTYPKD